MHFFRKRGHNLKNIDRISISYLFLSLGAAAVSTIWAIFLESIIHNSSLVGFLSTFFSVVGFLSYLILIPIVEKYNKIKLVIFSLLLFVISYSIFAFYTNFYLIIILGTILAIVGSLRITAFGILVRDKTPNQDVSKNEATIYTLLNLAWLISPLIAGYIAQRYGFGPVFILTSALALLSIFSFTFFKIRDNRKTKKIDYNVFKLLVNFFSKKERAIIYLLHGAVNFWWALIYIYIPIYLVDNGYSGFLVGLFLSMIVLPLVFLESFFGRIASKKGFKKLFFTGYLIIGVLSILSFFMPNFYYVLVLLVLASVGVSMLEPTTEAYFFDIIKESQRDKYYGIYNTAVDTGHLLGTFSSAILLLFFPFKYLFILFAIVMFIMLFLSRLIKEVIESRR
ncbi:MAG: MFS transporter [Candidatus Pacearchaeota archaeon]